MFIARKALGVGSLEDLEGRTFTFGSESSTSGRLMPAYYLARLESTQQGLQSRQLQRLPRQDLEARRGGSLRRRRPERQRLETRVEAGDVDLGKVEAFWTTPAYYDYHWVLRGDLAGDFGEDAQANITRALLALDAGNGDSQSKIMEAFQAGAVHPHAER